MASRTASASRVSRREAFVNLDVGRVPGILEHMRRKPRAKRYRKRLRLHFGRDEAQHPGVTGNISIGGLSILSAVPVPKGSRITIRVQLPDAPEPLTLRGNVRWARRVQLQIGMAPQSRMGVMFEELPPQAYLDMLA